MPSPDKKFRFIKSALNYIKNIRDPVVGLKLLNYQQPRFLLRSDFRTSQDIFSSGGFLPRANMDDILKLTLTDVEKYVKYDQNPFGFGCCGEWNNFKSFLDANKRHANETTFYATVGSAVSPLLLLAEYGSTEGMNFSFEGELIALGLIHNNFILASCGPELRVEFMRGDNVFNQMSQWNPHIPKCISVRDVENEKTMLQWLQREKADVMLRNVCNLLYKDVPSPVLGVRLDEDKAVVDLVEAVLSESCTIKPLTT